MNASILIVSRNRRADLDKTLSIFHKFLNFEENEICVFLDGCSDKSEVLQKKFNLVNWHVSKITLGASKARSVLYKKAKGEILFGFDDDAHPLQQDFIEIAEKIFAENRSLGILAFKEIKGVFKSDKEIPEELKEIKKDYLVKDFLGCGFAIRREVYNQTRGFPVWIDIYGEEVCVAMEVLELNYDIMYTYKITVNHRTLKQKMNTGGANYFRFGKQLKNTASFYLVYYPFLLMLKKIGRLYLLNFQKYGLRDSHFFKEYFKALGLNILALKKNSSYRKPVSKKTIEKFNKLSNPPY